MIVNFVVRTNLGLGINICMSLGMCMGPRMGNKMIQRKGRSFITALSLADLSLAALRLTALSLAPISLEISIRILLTALSHAQSQDDLEVTLGCYVNWLLGSIGW